MSKKDLSYGNNETLRSAFKQSLTKLAQISTRDLAYKQIKTLIIQNKTTSNLRIWLSVLSENRQKHNESQINVIGFIIQKYAKGLLDPLDKIPSLQKTVFRITELLLKCFADSQTNVQLACQKAWIQIYLSSLIDQQNQLKKKVLFNNLQALINGGGGKVSQTTAQLVIDGLLQSSLNKEDHEFFKEIAKRTLVLFLKTTVIHYSSLTCLQTIISFFGINNLIPLSQNIINKIITYIGLSPPNSSGYKIKSQCCNAFTLIGQQIDKNGLLLYPKLIKILEDLATDKVWAVQATGRKALSTWKNKKHEWEQQFLSKQERYNGNQQEIQIVQQRRSYSPSKSNINNSNGNFQKPSKNNWINPNNKNSNINIKANSNKQVPLVISKNNYDQNFYQQEQSKNFNVYSSQPQHKKYETYNQGFYRPAFNGQKYLHKNTGVGGGNNVQTVQNFYQKQKGQQTYSKKMEEIKKSIYRQTATQIQYDETIPWQQAKSLPVFPKQIKQIKQQKQENQDINFLQQWQQIVKLQEKGLKQQAVKRLLQMDDDIYFLRFMLQHGQGLLKDLTRPSSAKILKKMLSIQKSNFMEQMLFKMVGQTIKIKAGQILSNAQNLQITKNLQRCKNNQKLSKVSQKLRSMYDKSLLE